MIPLTARKNVVYPPVDANEIQGVPMDPTTPTDGQVIKYDAVSQSYKPSTEDAAPVTSVDGQVGDVDLSTVYEPLGAVQDHNEADDAHGEIDDANPHNHDRYTDGEADSRVSAGIATHTSNASAHHARPVQATESDLGIAEIATQAEADAGTDDLTIMTPLKTALAPEFVKGGEVAGPVTSTSGTFALAGTVTKTTTEGQFKLNVCEEMIGAGVSSGFTENLCEVEVRVDGSPVLTFTELAQSYSAHSGIAILTLTAASHSITWHIRRSVGGTVGIKNMKACLHKVVVQ